MQLRDHPLLSYQGARCWPPIWTNTRGARLAGEIGILQSVFGGRAGSHMFHLVIDYNNEPYAGTLIFDSTEFCKHMAQLLRLNLRRSIEEIGALDLP